MNKTILAIALTTALASQASYGQSLNHVGKQVLSKDQIINLLNPGAIGNQPLTRGIRINQPAQPTQSTQSVQQNETLQQVEQVQANNQQQQAAQVPTISMEINFEYNSSALTPESKLQLDPLGQALSDPQLAGMSFMIEGHADASGEETYNQLLSQQRSTSVGQYLYQNYGVNPNNLHLIGRGETQLLDPYNPTSSINRRVSITTINN